MRNIFNKSPTILIEINFIRNQVDCAGHSFEFGTSCVKLNRNNRKRSFIGLRAQKEVRHLIVTLGKHNFRFTINVFVNETSVSGGFD